MSLSPDQVRWVAHLARIELNPADERVVAQQLSAILEYIDLLNSVPTEGVEPLAHPLAVENIFREDEPAASLSAGEALANAPDRRGDFFAVPPVFD